MFFRLLKYSVIVSSSTEIPRNVSSGKIEVIANVFFCLFCFFHYFLLLAIGRKFFFVKIIITLERQSFCLL